MSNYSYAAPKERVPDEDILALHGQETLLRVRLAEAKRTYARSRTTGNQLVMIFARRELTKYLTGTPA